MFNLFQVGELSSHLTNELQLSIDKNDFQGIVNVRNHIVHGYDSLNNDTIINCLSNELEPFVDQLWKNALILYRSDISRLIGTKITVLVDSSINENHLFNLGHMRELSSPDAQLQKVVIIDLEEPIFQCKCEVIGAYKIKNDDSFTLLAVLIPSIYNESQIKDLIENKLGIIEYELILRKN